jgi:hypothetical protein
MARSRLEHPLEPRIVISFGAEAICLPVVASEAEALELARRLQRFAADLVESPSLALRAAGITSE